MMVLARTNRGFLDTRYEPYAITGGLFLFTALYYTRQLALQILSFFILLGVTAYWSYAIRRGSTPMGLSDFKLTRRRWGLFVMIAVVLALFGWFYFRFYVYLTRGQWIKLDFRGSLPAVLTIIAVSTAEELYFRGYLQNRLSHHHGLWKRVLIAVFTMALYKNVIHMWEGMPLILHVELLLVGILHNMLPSLWMEWSGSLVGPLVLHVAWDLLVYAPLGTIPYWVY